MTMCPDPKMSFNGLRLSQNAKPHEVCSGRDSLIYCCPPLQTGLDIPDLALCSWQSCSDQDACWQTGVHFTCWYRLQHRLHIPLTVSNCQSHTMALIHLCPSSFTYCIKWAQVESQMMIPKSVPKNVSFHVMRLDVLLFDAETFMRKQWRRTVIKSKNDHKIYVKSDQYIPHHITSPGINEYNVTGGDAWGQSSA